MAFRLKEDLFQEKHPTAAPKAYVAILMDGDAAMFSDEYLRHGHEGGRVAAQKLHEDVKSMVDKYVDYGILGPEAHNVEVRATFYGDFSTLANACEGAGVVPGANLARQCLAGFGGVEKFTSTNLSDGKNGAVLGCTHEGDYSKRLEELAKSGPERCKVTLIEGLPRTEHIKFLYNQYYSSGFTRIFRSDKIPLPSDIVTNPQRDINVDENRWRLDEPILARPTRGEVSRTKSLKLCFQWYLRGECTDGDCEYAHDVEPTSDHLRVCRYLTRKQVCPRREWCRDPQYFFSKGSTRKARDTVRKWRAW
ncbi:hypothetical protein BDY21DRAFT_364536 [Lineolata rhizophorae]|uniref:C3H1-type domain-containing protein n=1 Tax=Lineolata rhizophorae TaxID=578093 RepID=A0A6A6NXV5_9PEZI|nr:hypothetical protein BDY21DRAFT_364536 [Lineolata rhizophorae]